MRVLQDFIVFIETAKQGSITQAGHVLNLTPAAVSATIKRLESQFECALFIRSTRSIRLTNEGQLMLEKCQLAVEAIREGVSSVQHDPNQIAGHIKLAMPSDIGRNTILPLLDEFMDLHPNLTISAELSDSLIDLYTRPVDASFRYGLPPDSTMVALPIHKTNDRVVCASPSYIKQYGAPKTPYDLTSHNCINFFKPTASHSKWRFYQGKNTVEITAIGNRYADDGAVVKQWVIAGKGVGYKSRLDVKRELESGLLVELLPEWDSDKIPLNLVVTDKRLLTPAIHAIREFLIEKLN